MKPLPWSPTSIDTFTNCPRQYHHRYVLKDVPYVETEQQRWGNYVHKAFEDRQATRTPLPIELQAHEEYMVRLEQKPGVHFTEQEVALDRSVKPTSWAYKDTIWWRGKIDFLKLDKEGGLATIADYKTGKPHTKYRQLGMYAIHTFLAHDFVDLINAQFYWTQTFSTTKKVWKRDELPTLWAMFTADLRQYVEAFKQDVWQPRQSGLCRGYCPVASCEFHQEKRR